MIFDYNNIPKNIKPFDVLDYQDIHGVQTENVDLSAKNLYKEMEEIGWRMVQTCIEKDGIGLAAPQIGINKNLFIAIGFQKPYIWQFDGHFHMFINPTFKAFKGTIPVLFPEGCLSVPEQVLSIERPREISVEYWYFDKNKKLKKNTDKLEGFSARVFQHEHDHLLGTNIVEVESSQKKSRRRRK